MRDDLAERLCEAVTIAQGTSQKSDVWFAHFLGLTGVDFHNKSSANDEAVAVRNEIRRIVSEGEGTETSSACCPDTYRQAIDDLCIARAERDEARDRCIRAAQILIAEFGSDGPLNVDEAAEIAATSDMATTFAAARVVRR